MTSWMKQNNHKNLPWTMECLHRIIKVCNVILGIVLALSIGMVVAKKKGALIAREQNQPLARVIRQYDSVCLTRGCIYASSKVSEKMDMSVEPCDDFYRFVCGRFFKNPLEADTVAGLLRKQVSQQVRTALERPSTPMEPKPFKLAKNLYKSCMNYTAREAQGLDPLLAFLKKHGGWPVLMGTQWKDKYFNWTQFTNSVGQSRTEQCPGNILLNFGTNVDDKNSSVRVLTLWQTSLGLDRDYLIKGLGDEKVMAYYSYMVDIAVILGANRHVAEKELFSALEFEIELAKISLPQEELRNSTLLYNPMTISQLSENYPSIPWKAYLTRWLPPSIQVDDNEVVIVSVPSFITSLEKLIKQTPKRIQANYVMWRLVSRRVEFLNDEMRARQYKYSLATSDGMTQREPRWKQCVGVVSGNLGPIVGAQYVRKHFDEEAKKNASEMVDNIRAQFYKILQQVDWLDDDTRKSALAKAISMTSHIGYPDELFDDNTLEELFQGLEVSDANYFQGINNVTLFWNEYWLSKFRKPVDKSDWVSHASVAIVDISYNGNQNSLQIPASILQGEFFSKDHPRYMNYGGIGRVIGHEIIHGFDDRRTQKENGNMVDWWSESKSKKYSAKAQYIIDQYSNYSVKDAVLNLNGIDTQGEHIIGHGGLKIAYLAYVEWSARKGHEQSLLGLPYTPRQMFWINAASNECALYRIEALKHQIITDGHRPAKFRILRPMFNLPEFAEDFKCHMGFKMNAEKQNIL